MPDILRTSSVPFGKLFASPITTAIPSDPVPTTTAPTGDGVRVLTQSMDTSVHNNGSLIFYGVGSEAQTASAKVFLWHIVGGLYVPTLILDLSLTFGGATGIASQPVDNTMNFVNTITANAATTTNSKDIQSPASTNGIAKVDFDQFGAYAIQVIVGKNSATSIAALYKGF